MLPPVETTPRISREATRPTTLTALALALFAAQPALAQDAADAVGSVVDPQGTPGDPQPDQPTVDTARDSDELLTVPDPNAGLDALWAHGVRRVDMPMTPLSMWQRIQAAQ